MPLTTLLCAALLSVLLGFVYPSLAINRLPDDLPADLSSTPVMTFGRPQPGMLSMHTARSAQQMDASPDGLPARLRAFDGYLFVLEQDLGTVESAAQVGNVALERVVDFRSFYSRKAWLKFFRRGVGWPEWQQALRSRSTDAIAPRFVCLRLRSR